MSERDWDSPSGSLYRLDAALRSARMRCDVVCSNGTGWSPDGRTMYHTESFRYAVFAYDFDGATGEIVNRRPFIQLDPAGGEFPDGLTVTRRGACGAPMLARGESSATTLTAGRSARSSCRSRGARVARSAAMTFARSTSRARARR